MSTREDIWTFIGKARKKPERNRFERAQKFENLLALYQDLQRLYPEEQSVITELIEKYQRIYHLSCAFYQLTQDLQERHK